jgi:uncharacterized protein
MTSSSSRRQIRQAVIGEKAFSGGREIELTFRVGGDEPVPAILLLPPATAAVPAAILVHGYSSRREVMTDTIGRALFSRGIASLSIELPLHGTRADPLQAQSSRNPLAMMKLWKLALSEVRTGLNYLAARSEINGNRLAIVGYSMGAYLSVTVAAEEKLVKAVVLAAGGDLPEGAPIAAMARMVVDPVRSVARLAGRPLLMVNGKHDRTITPAQARRLYEAAKDPKTIMWYDSGHRLPEAASTAAADWLKQQLTGPMSR